MARLGHHLVNVTNEVMEINARFAMLEEDVIEGRVDAEALGPWLAEKLEGLERTVEAARSRVGVVAGLR